MPNARDRGARKRTTRTIDRLSYSHKKHKNKKRKEMRQKLQEKVLPATNPSDTNRENIKFGSFNINGLDLEAEWAVNQLLITRNFDVGKIIYLY